MNEGRRRLIVRNGVVYDDWSGAAGSTAEEYIEREPDSTFTGLYNEHGEPLHKQREAIGYNPFRWDTQMKKSKPMKKPKGKGKGC